MNEKTDKQKQQLYKLNKTVFTKDGLLPSWP